MPRKTTNKAPFGREVLAKAVEAEDVEVHLNSLLIGDQEMVEIREWNPSRQAYSLGLTMSKATAVALGLVDA